MKKMFETKAGTEICFCVRDNDEERPIKTFFVPKEKELYWRLVNNVENLTIAIQLLEPRNIAVVYLENPLGYPDELLWDMSKQDILVSDDQGYIQTMFDDGIPTKEGFENASTIKEKILGI